MATIKFGIETQLGDPSPEELMAFVVRWSRSLHLVVINLISLNIT